MFGHQKIGGEDQVVWIISSKLSANDDENKQLRFDYASPLGFSINIEVKVGRTVSACTAQI